MTQETVDLAELQRRIQASRGTNGPIRDIPPTSTGGRSTLPETPKRVSPPKRSLSKKRSGRASSQNRGGTNNVSGHKVSKSEMPVATAIKFIAATVFCTALVVAIVFSFFNTESSAVFILGEDWGFIAAILIQFGPTVFLILGKRYRLQGESNKAVVAYVFFAVPTLLDAMTNIIWWEIYGPAATIVPDMRLVARSLSWPYMISLVFAEEVLLRTMPLAAHFLAQLGVDVGLWKKPPSFLYVISNSKLV